MVRRVVAKGTPVTGDLLRSLTREELRLARLEMQFDRPDLHEKWTRAANDIQRAFRGLQRRRQFAVLDVARQARRVACDRVAEAQSLLERTYSDDDDERRRRLAAEALAALEAARTQDPACREILLVESQVFYAVGDFREARRAASRAVEENVEENVDLRALALRGRASCALRDLDAAIRDFTLVIEKAAASDGRCDAVLCGERDDLLAFARYSRGSARSLAGDWHGAEADLDAYLATVPPCNAQKRPTPADRAARRRRARALEALGVTLAANDKYSDAVRVLTEALILDPDPTAMCLLARVHCCERQWHLAEDRYRDALVLDPRCTAALVGLDQARVQHEPLPLLPVECT